MKAAGMSGTPQPIPEWDGVDARTFRDEIATRYRPAVLRGVVRHWPAVEHAIASIDSICAYLGRFDSGRAVDVVITPPHVRGRMFYNDDFTGFNFTRSTMSISAVNDKLRRYAAFDNRPSIAAQHALIADCLPGFADENRLPLLDASIRPRIWLGSAFVTPAHFDESSNIACVVAGRRRFTLFPPEQIANMYVGPLDFAPTGTPISLVSLRDPDFERFPRFREALAAALVAELEPGDALYIPPLWFHHVESLAKYNLLVNYWWGRTSKADSALNCLLLSLVSLKGLTPEQRRAWAAIFDFYVFNANGEAAQHIPEAKRGVLGAISPELAAQVRKFIVSQLQG
jgi:oxalate decarboxylase/phosphoglucose isomerase-like protein (cupin superfamily)